MTFLYADIIYGQLAFYFRYHFNNILVGNTTDL